MSPSGCLLLFSLFVPLSSFRVSFYIRYLGKVRTFLTGRRVSDCFVENVLEFFLSFFCLMRFCFMKDSSAF